MKKNLYSFLLLISSFSINAAEFNVEIENGLNKPEIREIENNYLDTVNLIVKDIMDNGISYDVGGTEMSLDGITVKGVKILIKKDVYRRNSDLANRVFKSQLLLSNAVNRSGYEIPKQSSWISTNPFVSQTCFILRFTDKSRNIIKSENLLLSNSISIYTFVRNTEIIPPFYRPYDPKYNDEIYINNDNIQLLNSDVKIKMTQDEMARVSNISIKDEKCH